ncbi:hypothetical protein cyc_09147 [Cyclospora cayetanensis]|uniref:Uncharacterized protein n=1 Tax=Cyclospora cayetanensis TaxID=88456 RepID=A0A1D3D7W0_9EIME|nr:hypothetical protein cyc_09147 [Cyclospora cayetanensis]
MSTRRVGSHGGAFAAAAAAAAARGTARRSGAAKAPSLPAAACVSPPAEACGLAAVLREKLGRAAGVSLRRCDCSRGRLLLEAGGHSRLALAAEEADTCSSSLKRCTSGSESEAEDAAACAFLLAKADASPRSSRQQHVAHREARSEAQKAILQQLELVPTTLQLQHLLVMPLRQLRTSGRHLLLLETLQQGFALERISALRALFSLQTPPLFVQVEPWLLPVLRLLYGRADAPLAHVDPLLLNRHNEGVAWQLHTRMRAVLRDVSGDSESVHDSRRGKQSNRSSSLTAGVRAGYAALYADLFSLQRQHAALSEIVISLEEAPEILKTASQRTLSFSCMQLKQRNLRAGIPTILPEQALAAASAILAFTLELRRAALVSEHLPEVSPVLAAAFQQQRRGFSGAASSAVLAQFYGRVLSARHELLHLLHGMHAYAVCCCSVLLQCAAHGGRSAACTSYR